MMTRASVPFSMAMIIKRKKNTFKCYFLIQQHIKHLSLKLITQTRNCKKGVNKLQTKRQPMNWIYSIANGNSEWLNYISNFDRTMTKF